MFNNVFITILGIVTPLPFRSLAGFAFVKHKSPGKNALFYLIATIMPVPPGAGAVPLFVTMKKLNLTNSLWSLIMPRIVMTAGTFYMHQYITDISDELIETAHTDGCGDFKMLTSIAIPVIEPAPVSRVSVTLIAR